MNFGIELNKTNEINDLRNDKKQTIRATVSDLEDLLYKPMKALDHGFVRVIDYMGDDSAIVQAARVSYGRGTKKSLDDKNLIFYLMRHWHTTPFEMCDIKFHVKLPIFVARQWIRHRTASINEYSARYSILDKEFYIPNPENLAAQSSANRQGRDQILEGEEAQRVLELLRNDSESAYMHYKEMLNMDDGSFNVIDINKKGLSRELARMNIPVNFYTQWYWKVNLHNLFHFLRLRADEHAQYEIRVYADIILSVVEKWVPHAYAAFLNYRMNATNISQNALLVIKKMINGQKVSQEDSDLSKREWNELMSVLNSDK